ncbi:putative sugar phosphate/phosphate translocator [Citrus sinensis]|uniref:Sugar phosphate/phosphate translocator n=1 Tax=Citrus sinensis TaxID=2711 RepID=A0ACB8K1L8_CITSI|nr:putative sugar phosphate/phosphate translocator [Citrus sinensis]
MVHIIVVHLPNLSTCSPNLNRGNTLLRYLLVSLSQAIGATTPFFDAISTFLLTCNKEFAEVYCALMPVVFVIVLASNNEPLFYLLGFLVCIGSTARRALKYAEKLNSMNLLVYMAPMVASIFLPHTLYICWFMRLLSSIKHQQSFHFEAKKKYTLTEM